MMMEAQDEAAGCKDHTQIMIKGKRTKRQRAPSPLRLTMASSSSSLGESIGGEGGTRISYNSGGLDNRPLMASPTTSAEFTESTEEEEDMANCLILLAQGRQTRKLSEPAAIETSSKATAAGLYVYQCKTCNRCFPSFQALGGHRASHKKPKANSEEKKALTFLEEENYRNPFSNMSTTLSLQISNKGLCSNFNKAKVHECSICGAEFSSGQALGGHMRRHRAFAGSTTAMATTVSLVTSNSPPELNEAKKPRNVLQLDLNLPAPDDDHRRESKFSLTAKEQVLVFSPSSLVDCHY